MQRYENLLEDLPGAAAELADFIDVPTDAAGVEEIAAECSLARSEEVTTRLRRTLVAKGLPECPVASRRTCRWRR